MVVFLIRAYYTLIVYLCQEHCGANCGRIFASLKREPLEPLRWLRNGLFESLIPQPKNKKRRSTRLLLSLLWSGLRDSLGSLLCSPTRTRPTNSPPDCSLLRNGLFESLIPQPKNKKRRSTRLLLSLFMERITRLARLAFVLADTHPTDEQSPGLFFASQRSFRVSHTTTKEQKKKKYETSSFFVMERITRLELATFTLAR